MADLKRAYYQNNDVNTREIFARFQSLLRSSIIYALSMLKSGVVQYTVTDSDVVDRQKQRWGNAKR